MLARRKHPGGHNTLDELCTRYGVDRSRRTQHGALLDAELLSAVYVELSTTRQAPPQLEPIKSAPTSVHVIVRARTGLFYTARSYWRSAEWLNAANDAFSITAAQLDRVVCATLIERGLRLRVETFDPPNPQPHDKLSEDASRVLIHLFKTSRLEGRDVGAMAIALRFERSILQYHLDRLKEAGFAEETGLNYLHTRLLGANERRSSLRCRA